MLKSDLFSDIKEPFVSVQSEVIMSEEIDYEAVVKRFRVFGA
jgi:hypothetical protein